MSETIRIVVNGDEREVPGGLSVAALLAHLQMRSERVAIERTLDILPRGQWEGTKVAAGDRYEIVQLVGGG